MSFLLTSLTKKPKQSIRFSYAIYQAVCSRESIFPVPAFSPAINVLSSNLSSSPSPSPSSTEEEQAKEGVTWKILSNPSLEEIKRKGMNDLERITENAIYHSRKSLLNKSRKGNEEEEEDISSSRKGPTIRQLKRANQISEIIRDIMYNHHLYNNSSFSSRDDNMNEDSIEIRDVEVSKDLRYARIFWSLPQSMAEELSQEKLKELSLITQNRLNIQVRDIQRLVGRRINGKFVPKLRFVPEDTRAVTLRKFML